MILAELKIFWEEALMSKKITKLFFDSDGLRGFLLDDGTKIGYDYKDKGLFVDYDAQTGKPTVYN